MAWTALPDGSTAFVNQRWREYTRLSAADTADSSWHAVAHAEDIDRLADKWRASVATGEPFEDEVRLRRAADGQYRWFLVRGVPLRDGRGKILKWYGITADIEDRKRAEEQRERLHHLEADLAHINRVSTMGELTASLAHELKQPIAAAATNARTCLRWLQRDKPDVEEACETASRIVNDINRATDIINRVRSLYKKETPERELVDVNEVTAEIVALLRSEATRYGVLVRIDGAAQVPKVRGDRVQLQQVLMNLILNGIEAMKDVDGDRELTIKSQRAEGDQLLISISDTGVGLPTGDTDQIFAAFFTTKPEGTGMGLAIARSIVESHSGRLWATANCGSGATFHLTLPADELQQG
jgi:PAS domain S-box-containing protein